MGDDNDITSLSKNDNDNNINDETDNNEMDDNVQDSKIDKDDTDDDDDDDDEDQLNDNKEHISKMRSLAYQILLNALQVIASTNQQSNTSTTSYHSAYTNLIITNQILPSILSEIIQTYNSKTTSGNIGLNAHDATIATQILHLLLIKQKSEQNCDIITNDAQ